MLLWNLHCVVIKWALETLHRSPEAKELEAKGAPMLHQPIVWWVGGIVRDKPEEVILLLAAACRLSRVSPMTQLLFFSLPVFWACRHPQPWCHLPRTKKTALGTTVFISKTCRAVWCKHWMTQASLGRQCVCVVWLHQVVMRYVNSLT